MVTNPETTHDKGTRRLTTVLCVDICGYSALAERDETAAIETVRYVRSLMTGVAEAFRGRLFHIAGDGFLAEFPSARDGVSAALQLIGKIRDRSELPSSLAPPQVRAGLHVGDVIEEADGNLLGHGVNIAARLQQEASPNGIIASVNIMNLVGDSFPQARKRRHPLSLKNIEAPVMAYELTPSPPLQRWLSRLGLPTGPSGLFRGPAGVALSVTLAVACMGVLLFAWNLKDRVEAGAERALESKIDRIVVEYFPDADAAQFADTAYIRSVLRDLGHSRRPAGKASFALIEEGNIHDAIVSLEGSMTGLAPEHPDYVATLHQIGALAYQYAPHKAAAAYESILLVEPGDVSAMVKLGHVYDVIGETGKANRQYDAALASGLIEEETYLSLQMDRAFNMIMRGNYEEGATALMEAKPRVLALGSPAMQSRLNTELGIALERLDRLEEAEAVLVSALGIQRQYGLEPDMSRAFNVMGQIAEKRADLEPASREQHLRAARQYYQQQYETDLRLDKKLGISEALYYIGGVEFRLGRPAAAREAWLSGLRIAREHRLVNIEFLTWIGLAQVAKAENEPDLACDHLKKAEDLYIDHMDSAIGPRTARIITDIGCPFAGLT